MNKEVLVGRVAVNLEVIAEAAGRIEGGIGRTGVEDVLIVLTEGACVCGNGGEANCNEDDCTRACVPEGGGEANCNEDDCTLKVNAGGRILDCGSEAGVREPAGNFGTSAKECFAFGVHTHGDGGRKAEGVCLTLR